MNMHQDQYIAARGVNACVFCPRLFWLEYVAGEFADNEHTIEGRHVHRQVDKPGGAMPSPNADAGGDDKPGWQTRSLWLSDPSLGVSAQLDVVEHLDDNTVMPVDTKKGKPDSDGNLWPADRVQLTLQALLLRAHGYETTHIAAWYFGARKRVRLELESHHIDEALDAVSLARTWMESPVPPPPLIDSPKCPGCSLHAICLPDEVNALREDHLGEEPDGEEDAVRRIQMPRDDALPVYVQHHGTRVGLAGQCLKITPPASSDQSVQEVGFGQISQLNLMGAVQITTQALQACLRNEVAINFFSAGGWFYGRASGTESRQVQTRIAQFAAYGGEPALAIARVLIADKIANSRVLLRRNAQDTDAAYLDHEIRELDTARKQAELAASAPTLLGIEGSAARRYWQIYSEMLARDEPAFAMVGRTRRPPQDPTNAMLSFGYALLTKDCNLAVSAAGLDPYLGMFHTAHHGRPSMALDLMEPFRPLIVDSMVLQMVRRREVKKEDFIRSGQAVAMKERARKALLQAYERRMDELITHPTFGYRISYRRVLYVHARLIARVLSTEIAKMPSFRTR
ncbi:MAG: CRISPR-associated endonuclease Cas1 [Bradymonadaceae bacterium]